MGAPGEAFLCGQGHLFHWIEEHLFWDDELFEHSRKVEAEKCPCGDQVVIKLSPLWKY